MLDKNSKISLTYTLGGECLVSPGVYTVAKINVTNSFSKNEVFRLIEPSKTLSRPVYGKAVQMVTLDSSFVDMALEQPTKPKEMNYHKWLRTPLGKISQSWKKMKDEQKLKFHIELYVLDMGGEDYSFEII